MEEAEARRLMADAKAAGRRDAAVRQLRELYLEAPDAGLWAALRDTFTAPELEGLAPPEETTVGPEREPLLPRRPYRDVLFSSLAAPVASGSAVFMLVVSGPLMLGSILALKAAGCVGLAIGAFLYGYLSAFMFDVLLGAAEGRARGPRLLSLLWHEGSRFEFVGHFARWLGAGFAAFWPVLAVLAAAGREITPAAWAALALASLVGVFWHPIALIQAAIGNGFSSFNYPTAFDRVRRLGADYARCAGFFLATTAAVIVLQRAGAAWAGEREEAQMIVRVVGGWAAYASWLMQARAAGLLAWSRPDLREKPT